MEDIEKTGVVPNLIKEDVALLQAQIEEGADPTQIAEPAAAGGQSTGDSVEAPVVINMTGQVGSVTAGYDTKSVILDIKDIIPEEKGLNANKDDTIEDIVDTNEETGDSPSDSNNNTDNTVSDTVKDSNDSDSNNDSGDNDSTNNTDPTDGDDDSDEPEEDDDSGDSNDAINDDDINDNVEEEDYVYLPDSDNDEPDSELVDDDEPDSELKETGKDKEHQDNGFGNGDDDAPGGSEFNNNAENAGGNHNGIPDAPGNSGHQFVPDIETPPVI